MRIKFGKTSVTLSFEKIFLLNYWYGYENESIRCTTGLAVIELGCHEYVKIILYANNWLAHLSLISIYYHNRTLSCYEINVQKENANILFLSSTVFYNKCGND